MPTRYRIIQEPMGRYHVGDTISEAKILKILKDRVVLERDGSTFQILLRDPNKSKNSRSSSKNSRSNRRSRRR